MTTKITFIYAASASGKTTWVESLPKTSIPFAGLTDDIQSGPQDKDKFNVAVTGNAFVIDGDRLVEAHTRWPTKSGWWQTDDGRHIAFSNVLGIFTMLQRLSVSKPAHIIVVWNGGIWPVPQVQLNYGEYWETAFSKIDFKLVEIPEMVHRDYVKARIKNDRAATEEEGSYHGFPRNWRDAQNNRAALRRDFIKIGSLSTDVYSSFEEALPDDIGSDTTEIDDSTGDQWTLAFAARGYKDSDPPNGGSTRIVWKVNEADYYLVMKLFDDGGTFPEEPRTIKFWKTSDFKSDYMKWASSQHRFEPTDEEMQAFTSLREELLTDIRNFI